MSAPLDDIASYSAFVYALRERHPLVTGSTLTLAPIIGATLGKLEGGTACQGKIHLAIRILAFGLTEAIILSCKR